MAGLASKIIKGRLLVWVLLIPLTLGVALAPWWLVAVYALLWTLAASAEYLRLYLKPFRLIYLLYLIGPVVVWAYTLDLFSAPFGLFIASGLLVQLLLWIGLSSSRPNLFFPLLFLPIYLGFLPAHFVLIKQESLNSGLGYAWLVFPLVVTWINDSAAYFWGNLFGRTRLAPALSPKKTVEGFLSGLACAVIAGVVFSAIFLPLERLWISAVLAIAVSLAAVLGDFLESTIKRERGVKHSSTILGGHGGFLDRVDSLLAAIAVYYYLHLLIQGS